MALVDRRIQRAEVALVVRGVGQPYSCQERLVSGVGQEPGFRVPALVDDGGPQIQQGGTAAKMNAAGLGVGVRHGALEVGPDLESAAAPVIKEAPGLRVVHRRGGHRVVHQGGHPLVGRYWPAHRNLLRES